jgi:hypothetical protein
MHSRVERHTEHRDNTLSLDTKTARDTMNVSRADSLLDKRRGQDFVREVNSSEIGGARSARNRAVFIFLRAAGWVFPPFLAIAKSRG